MISAEHPRNEAARIAALRSYDILDTEPEAALDDLTQLAAHICGTPIALVSLVDEHRQWFKSRVGLDATETPRDVAFCAHAILEPERVFVIEDSLADERFADNPLATQAPNVRFYAGAPLVTPDGAVLGTLCVIDHFPRGLDPGQLDALRALGRQVVSQFELRRRGHDLRETAQELERSNDELREFTSIAAHDLREPLRKIVSFGALLETDLGQDLPERAAEDLHHITDGARRMAKLVEELLTLSRTGSAELNSQRVELADCAQAALDALSLCVTERGAVVDVAPLPPVVGDATLLTQVFQNLLANALKFCTADVPRIDITCEVQGDEVVVGMRDNGIGIEPQFCERIFEPFRRLHARGSYEGSGIGLATVRKAVQRHRGRIWVESEPGQGSHFLFSLPITGEIATPGAGASRSTQLASV